MRTPIGVSIIEYSLPVYRQPGCCRQYSCTHRFLPGGRVNPGGECDELNGGRKKEREKREKKRKS